MAKPSCRDGVGKEVAGQFKKPVMSSDIWRLLNPSNSARKQNHNDRIRFLSWSKKLVVSRSITLSEMPLWLCLNFDISWKCTSIWQVRAAQWRQLFTPSIAIKHNIYWRSLFSLLRGNQKLTPSNNSLVALRCCQRNEVLNSFKLSHKTYYLNWRCLLSYHWPVRVHHLSPSMELWGTYSNINICLRFRSV